MPDWTPAPGTDSPPTVPGWMLRRGLYRHTRWRLMVRKLDAALFYSWWRWGDKW